MVADFGVRGRDVSDRLQEPPVVEPVDLFESGELDSVEAAPRTSTADHLGLKMPITVSAKALS